MSAPSILGTKRHSRARAFTSSSKLCVLSQPLRVVSRSVEIGTRFVKLKLTLLCDFRRLGQQRGTLSVIKRLELASSLECLLKTIHQITSRDYEPRQQTN